MMLRWRKSLIERACNKMGDYKNIVSCFCSFLRFFYTYINEEINIRRIYKINPDGKAKGTDNNLLAKTSFDKFKQEMIEEFGEKE